MQYANDCRIRDAAMNTSLPVRILYVDGDARASCMMRTLAYLDPDMTADAVDSLDAARQTLTCDTAYDFIVVSLDDHSLTRPDVLHMISQSACLNGAALVLLTEFALTARYAATSSDTFIRKPKTLCGFRGLLDLLIASPASETHHIVGTGQWNAPIELFAA